MALAVLCGPATTLLSTLARVKDALSLVEGSADDLLLDLLGRASDAITRECGRTSFGVAQYQETLGGSGSHLLGLRNVPLLAVARVTQDGEELDPTAPLDGYTIEDAEAGALFRAAGWGRSTALLAWGSDASASRYILPGGTGLLRYSVTYTAGYLLPEQADVLPYDPRADPVADPPPLPGAVEQACLLTVGAWWRARGHDPAVSHVKTADQSVTYAPTQSVEGRALPTAALGLLRNYRRVV